MQGVPLSSRQGPDYGDIEAEIEKELEEDEKNKIIPKSQKERSEELGENEERWPPPMEPLEYDSERDCPNKSSAIVPPPPEMEDQNDEEKKYILEKIQLANRELQDQEAPDLTRRRRLHFKDKLVDLVVPPVQFEKEGNTGEVDVGKGSKYRATDSESETEISEKLSELKVFTHEESGSASVGSCRSGESSEGGEEVKGGSVLVEIDGKFDLVSLKEVESQGLLPPIAKKISDYSHSSQHPQEQTASSGKVLQYTSASRPSADSSHLQQGAHHFSAPRPPAQPRSRPSSANHGQRGSQRNGIKRRVQSAAGTTCQTTYNLSTRQKEQLQRMQERKEKLAREVGQTEGQKQCSHTHMHYSYMFLKSVYAFNRCFKLSLFPCQAEQRKHEEEEQRRHNNEQAFKAWLMKKREKIQEEKRIHRAQEMERMNPKV